MNINWINRIKVIPRNYQLDAVNAMLQYNSCLLQAPTGTGKTNIIIYLIFALAKKTIIVVPKTDLIEQTYNRIIDCTDVNPDNVEKYNSRKPRVKPITIITWQSLATALKNPKKWQLFDGYFDCVVCDECHKVGVAELLYTIGVDKLGCSYRYGVSATPYRNNGETRELLEFFNNNKYIINIETAYSANALIRPIVHMVQTGMQFDCDVLLNRWEKLSFTPEQKLGVLKKELGINNMRSYLIRDHIQKTKQRCNLVLSYTTVQCDIFYRLDHNKNKVKIYGSMSTAEKKDAMKEIIDTEEITIYATQSFLGEGTDIPKLDTLYITTPFAGGSKTVQFAGRVLRPCEDKKAVHIYDYCDYINYNPYNQKEINLQGWNEKRKKEYQRLAPVFIDEWVEDVL